jgi:hypothetical protein
MESQGKFRASQISYVCVGGSSVSNLKAMFEKKPAADPFPKKPATALGGSRAPTATTQPE